jgi:hypothetical protein
MIHPVKNQHYVPRLLLKNFSKDSETHIWTFDKISFLKKWKAIEQRAIKSVASADYFYDKEVPFAEDSFEHQFGLIEDGVAPIIMKLSQTADLHSLSEGEKELLALFVAIQMTRTKGSLINVDRLNSDLIDQLKQAGMDIPKAETDELWKSHMRNAHQYSEILLTKKWILLRADSQFYSSDNPVVLNNYTNRSDVRGTLGLKSEGVEIYFPLNDSLVLFLACEQTYAAFRVGTYPAESRVVMYCNSLQVIYAERFVFSSRNDFDLAASVTQTP